MTPPIFKTNSAGKRLALSVGIIATVVALLVGAWAAFTATTQNDANNLRAGTVHLTDDDLGTAMFDVVDARPGDDYSKCIKVINDGSLAVENLAIWSPAGSSGTSGNLAPYLNVTIERGDVGGSGTFDDCTGFVATDEVYYGPLEDLPTDESGSINMPDDIAPGDHVVYKITVQVDNDDAAQNKETLGQQFVWKGFSN